jgi:hypothetical protein
MAVVLFGLIFLVLIPLAWIIVFDLNHNDRGKDEKK